LSKKTPSAFKLNNSKIIVKKNNSKIKKPPSPTLNKIKAFQFSTLEINEIVRLPSNIKE
jgi:hypothetical protein